MKKILLMLCAAALFSVSQAAPKSKAQTYEKNRLELIKPVKKGVLQLRPTFNSCGFYFGSSKVKSPVLEYRKSGSGNGSQLLLLSTSLRIKIPCPGS